MSAGAIPAQAELLATLNHPNIAAVYGLEKSEGLTGIVLELVEGDTLADAIARGPIPIDDALRIARQIADALEAAAKGVVHRDLKPVNIKVTPDGFVKVVDFGLAKMLEAEGPTPSLAMSPTLSVPVGGPHGGHATITGAILGTAAYMSPEQARGKPVDRRADIWAFGCVLYEMLTGRQVFETGQTVVTSNDARARRAEHDSSECEDLTYRSWFTHSPSSVIMAEKEAGMGDKGGKKDKEKIKQQQVKKQKQEEQKKQDKARPRTP